MSKWMSRRLKLCRTQSRSGRMRDSPKGEHCGLGPYVTQGSLGFALRFLLESHQCSMQVKIQREYVISVSLARTFRREDLFVHTEWGEEGSSVLPEGDLRDSSPSPSPVIAAFFSGHTCTCPEPQECLELAPRSQEAEMEASTATD